MTTTTVAPVFTPTGRDLSFGGAVRSEWLKLRSIRSTWWSYALVLLITIGLSAQMSSQLSFDGVGAKPSHEAIQAMGVYATMVSLDFSALVVSVLGVLVIAGEYGSGMIRSTFVAVPKRVPALLAKAIVFAVVTFVVSAVAFAVTVPVSVGLLAANGYDIDLGDSNYWLAYLGGALYLSLIGLIAFSIGAIIRNTAGGIAAALGLAFVAPLILSVISGMSQQVWVQNLQALLPSRAGTVMFTHPGYQAFASPGEPPRPPDGVWTLDPGQGALILVAWIVVLMTAAVILLKRRDA
jgi:ABC-2 type transport system permease protein